MGPPCTECHQQEKAGREASFACCNVNVQLLSSRYFTKTSIAQRETPDIRKTRIATSLFSSSNTLNKSHRTDWLIVNIVDVATIYTTQRRHCRGLVGADKWQLKYVSLSTKSGLVIFGLILEDSFLPQWPVLVMTSNMNPLAWGPFVSILVTFLDYVSDFPQTIVK